MNKIKKYSAAQCSAVITMGCLWAAAASSASGLTIDGFTTEQSATVSGGPAGFKSDSNSVLAPEALGGERDIYIERTSLNNATVGLEVAAAGDGITSYRSGVFTTGRGQIVWDGLDGSSALSTTGLGGLDLTVGGAHDAFRLRRTSDLGGFLTITVYEDAQHVSEIVLTIPADPTFIFSPVDVSFASFLDVGTLGGASFDSVGAIALTFGGVAGTDIGVNLFTTTPSSVPDGSVGWVWAASLIGLLALGPKGCGRIRVSA